jgi:uncharacterized membrane protein
LAALLGLFVMAAVGASEAKAQNSLIRVCNYTAQAADIVVAGISGGQYVITGWWTAQPGGCTNTRYVGYGWVYLYAINFSSGTEWTGNDKRYCIESGSAFERPLNPPITCAPNLLKGFSGFYTQSGVFTWNLTD